MSTSTASTPRHSVRLTALRTGLTPHVLRAWERRYQVVTPARSDGGQRLYSDLDVGRLRLLRGLTERGHNIGRLAKTPLADLERMARDEGVASDTAELAAGVRARDLRSAALDAARRLDGAELQRVLERAAVTLGVPDFLDEVASPALRNIGQGWSEGTLSVAHEHLATVVFRRVLGWILQVYGANGEGGPRLVVATPPRQAHELGALLAAVAAAAEGWDVRYLGADLPIPEILSSARQIGASAVALSIVYPRVDSALMNDLQALSSGLDHAKLLVGGAAASAERERLSEIGVEIVDSLGDFRASLHRLQQQT